MKFWFFAANFRIPAENDIFEEISFTELPRSEAEKLVSQYNIDGKNYKKTSRFSAKPNQPDAANPPSETEVPKFRPDRTYGSTSGQSTAAPSEVGSFSSAAPSGKVLSILCWYNCGKIFASAWDVLIMFMKYSCGSAFNFMQIVMWSQFFIAPEEIHVLL